MLDDYSIGVNTNRDAWVYGFDKNRLLERVEQFVDTYNAQVLRWQRKGGASAKLADVVSHDDRKIKWSSSLKSSLQRGEYGDFDASCLRRTMYRPYVRKWLYFDPLLIHRKGHWHEIFPTHDASNLVLCVTGPGAEKPFLSIVVGQYADLHVVGPGAGSQCIPFFVYRPATSESEADWTAEDGSHWTKKENLTDWALAQFRAHYADDAITKHDVFHYAYAVLHHPAYRERYAADLKRSLPRLPFAPEFWPFAEAGNALADLHVGYETGPAYPLALSHQDGTPLTYRVEKMVLDKDAGTLRLNDSLTLTGIPDEAHRYRLGNRSALEWLVDQLRVKTDKRSGITHDPNASFQDGEIVDLIRRVTHVSVETVRIVEGLPGLGLPEG